MKKTEWYSDESNEPNSTTGGKRKSKVGLALKKSSVIERKKSSIAARKKSSTVSRRSNVTTPKGDEERKPIEKKNSILRARSKRSNVNVKTAAWKPVDLNLDLSLSVKDVDEDFYKELQKSQVTKKSSVHQLTQSVPPAHINRTPTRRAPFKPDGSFDYMEFLDSHYADCSPEIKRMNYTKEEIDQIQKDAIKIFEPEPILLDVAPPFIVVGDIHGQYNDLVNMFMLLGFPPKTRYLFLGDYIDRGLMQVETIMLLLAYKICYPTDIILLRGNHEFLRINYQYGFFAECRSVFGAKGEEIWLGFNRVFNNMPVTALIGAKILCMHGGLSPNLRSLDQLRNTKKPIRNPSYGVINDLVWSDPESNILGWTASPRGSGCIFGDEVASAVMDLLKIDMVIRAHQLQLAGYLFSSSMRILTVFSAPNYSAVFRNAAAMVNVKENLSVNLIQIVPETIGCRNRIQLSNLVWNDDVDEIGDWGEYELEEDDEQKQEDKDHEDLTASDEREDGASSVDEADNEPDPPTPPNSS